MANMSRYCKAYLCGALRSYKSWKENTANLAPSEEKEASADRRRILSDSDHFYLHDNFVVTDGIFVDEHVVFNEVTQEWIDFCTQALKFQPSFEPIESKATEAVVAAAGE